MKLNVDQKSLLICRPRYYFQLLNVVLSLFLLSALNIVFQTKGMTLLTLCVGLTVIWMIGVMIYSLPITLKAGDDGIIISRWGRHYHIPWSEIEFVIERGRFIKEHGRLVIGSKTFPQHRVLSGLMQVSKWCPTYSISYFEHTNYNHAVAVFKKHVPDIYRRSKLF